MAYATGTATSMADLLSALQNACTGNGWTLSGDVIHKGGCHVSLTANTVAITLKGGTGIDGSNALVDPSYAVYFTSTTQEPWTWPVTWYAFVFDTEVYLVVNNHVDAYIYLAFGSSPLPGVGGTGNWISSVDGKSAGLQSYTNWDRWRWDTCYAYAASICPFMFSYDWYASGSNWSNYIHADIDGTGAVWHASYAQKFTNWLCAVQPNSWNDESALAPIQPGQYAAASTMRFIGAALTYARYIRIDYLEPGQIITLGSDRWMIFPCWRKDASQRNGASPSSNAHTGTFGHAIRYDGP